MFKKLKEFFHTGLTLEKGSSNQASDAELQIAVGMLLLQMAGVDEDFAPEEVKTVFASMQSQFSLSQDETTELLEVADIVRKDKAKMDAYFRAINDNFDVAQKQLIYAMMWKVVLADGKVEKFEDRFATQVKFRLQLTDAQVDEAKQQAASGEV